MKRFRFTLKVLEDVQLMREKEQRAALFRANEALRVLHEEREANNARTESLKAQYVREMHRGTNVMRLEQYADFFDYLQQEDHRLAAEIIKAENLREKRMEILLETMKEIKVLEKLREKQYEEYQRELRGEEDKQIDDFLSFRVRINDLSGGEQAYGRG